MIWLQLSVRAYHRALKLASAIAGLAGEENIQTTYLALAEGMYALRRPDGRII
ncbi:MAG: hypothetical protein HN392_11475 [Anaerolineae bacterium]|jgi:predicted ATPase with chaperone activity|nr:hypothetical protein [Anaerolineae bacterium]MBT7074200.1 hypothetical protein [Anaerolineae bacterium]MBT7990247.1 hypothetical protein [Anaerolineae bacterium]